MARLSGSPLGLIGVDSSPTRDGMSTFNGGKSRNVNIFYYNTGREGNSDRKLSSGMYSLFSNSGVVRPWPNITKLGTDSDTTGLSSSDGKSTYKSISRNRLHNNEVYDTSLLNIIEKLSGTPAALKPSDFAYCTKVGVFPNNRLMIARRFAGPVSDNIYRKSSGGRPLALLVSWKPQDEDFLEFDFGESWEEAKADFTGVLTEVGEDFMGKSLGAKVGGAASALPLPGFTEQVQRKILEKMGVYSAGSSDDDLPSGNPNLIKMAKRRKTVGPGEAGSGLTCNIKIKMTCEYEQKFISGLDPTIVWQDLLATILRFGSSNSADYGLSSASSDEINKWVKDPTYMLSRVAESILDGLKGVTDLLKDAASQLFKREKSEEEIKAAEESSKKKLKDEENAFNSFIKGITSDTVTNKSTEIRKSIDKTIGKYKEEVKGIVFALSGLPSTPWHITIGNPLRPVFSSGDMYTDNVSVKLGSDLAFNDLPSKITVVFTLINARPLGIQEIMKKFNTGYLRTIDPAADWSGNKPSQLPGDLAYGSDIKDKSENELIKNSNGDSSISNTNSSLSNKNNIKTTENAETAIINSDANSTDSPVLKDGNIRV